MIQELRNNVAKQLMKLETLQDMHELTITPKGSGWNGAQCIQHMNLATELYLTQIEEKIDDLKPQKRAYKPGFWARKFINGLSPDDQKRIKHKMKTLKAFEPGNPDPQEAIQRLKANLQLLEQILDQVEGKDMRSFKVTTALGPILKFHLGDALRFISAHNDRHFLQLEKILASSKASSIPA